MILTLRTSRSLTAVPNGRKDCFWRRGVQFVSRVPLVSTFAFLTFAGPLAVPSDVSAVLFKALICFRSHFIAEEGYSILTETSSQSFLVSDNKNFYSFYLDHIQLSIFKNLFCIFSNYWHDIPFITDTVAQFHTRSTKF